MNATNTLKKQGSEKTFDYIYKDPDKNMPKIMDWADKFAEGEFPTQREMIREAITDPEHPYYNFIRNLHCTGCWAAEYGHKLNLTYDEIDDIICQGKKLGVYLYIYTGGEPGKTP